MEVSELISEKKDEYYKTLAPELKTQQQVPKHIVLYWRNSVTIRKYFSFPDF